MEIILSDLGIGLPVIKGQDHPVRNCWHFSTDGNYTEVLFRERLDFVDAMNRIYFLSRKYRIVILAFCLMDNHIHLILYGLFEECNRFVHELVRQISSAIARRHGLRHELQTLPDLDLDSMEDLSGERRRELFRTREPIPDDLKVYEGLILPNNYIPVQLVESIFRSARAYHFFMNSTREEDVESRGGSISRLSLPDAEMRQHKRELLKELFGRESSRELNTQQRIRLGKEIKRRYNCSPKQIVRLVGLNFEEYHTFFLSL